MLQEQIDEIDGALWGLLYSSNGKTIECETTVYKFENRCTPINEETGSYKYHIFTFKPNEPTTTIEFMKAYIGDVRNFIDNYAKAGYNGLMVKEGCIPKKAIKDMIRVTCKSFNVPEKSLKPILSQV